MTSAEIEEMVREGLALIDKAQFVEIAKDLQIEAAKLRLLLRDNQPLREHVERRVDPLQRVKTTVAYLGLERQLALLPGLDPRIKPMATIGLAPGQPSIIVIHLDATVKAKEGDEKAYPFPGDESTWIQHRTKSFTLDTAIVNQWGAVDLLAYLESVGEEVVREFASWKAVMLYEPAE